MRKTFVAGTLAVAVAVTGAAFAAREKHEEREKAGARAATISREEAVRIAQGAAKGKVIEATLEDEDGHLVYNVEVKSGDETKEVIVDAGNGKVLAVNADEDGEGPEGDEKAEGPEKN